MSTCGLPTGDCPRDEHGCRTTGEPVTWQGRCVGFSANLAGTSELTNDQWNAAFDAAFQSWELVDCGGGEHPSIEFYTLRPTTCRASQYDPTSPNVNAVYFTDSGWAGPQTKANLDDVLARTKLHFNGSQIMDADIAINSARHDFSVHDNPGPNDHDLVSVLTHEVGHFLGLDHSDREDAVMYFSYNAGTASRVPQADDIAAVCTLYPPGRKATCNPVPAGGLADTCDPRPTVGCAVGATRGREDGGTFIPITLAIFGLVGARAVGKRWRTR